MSNLMGTWYTGYNPPFTMITLNWEMQDFKIMNNNLYLKFNDDKYHLLAPVRTAEANSAISFVYIEPQGTSTLEPKHSIMATLYSNGVVIGSQTNITSSHGYTDYVEGYHLVVIAFPSMQYAQIGSSNTGYGAPENESTYNIIGWNLYTPQGRAQIIPRIIALENDLPEFPFEWDSSQKAGGDGDYENNYTDDIELVSETDLNANSLSSTKFVTTYMLTIPQMNDLGNKLWSIISALGNSVLKPQDFIISCCMIPYTSTGSQKLIKAGWLLLDGAMGSVIAKQYVRVPCGTLSLPEKWGSAIDYQTQLSIVLPFIGERALSAQEFMGGQIKVDYTIDLITGACVAAITAIRGDLDSVLYQFTGNCASQIPITSQDFSRLLGGIGLTAQSGSGTMNGNSTATITSKTGERTKESEVDNRTESSQSSRNSGVNSNLNFSAFAPQCNKTGDLSRTVGFMTIRKPYLIIRRPIQCLAENFRKYKGYVSNITAKLSDLEGYTEVGFCNLSVPSATSQELMEIRALLSSGVII